MQFRLHFLRKHEFFFAGTPNTPPSNGKATLNAHPCTEIGVSKRSGAALGRHVACYFCARVYTSQCLSANKKTRNTYPASQPHVAASCRFGSPVNGNVGFLTLYSSDVYDPIHFSFQAPNWQVSNPLGPGRPPNCTGAGRRG